MRTLILRRLLASAVLVLAVSLLTFLLQAAAPGDTARTILGDHYDPHTYQRLRTQLGLDQPVLVQYWHWLSGVARGDLGVSPISGLDVSSELANRLPVSLSLILCATAATVLLGVALGLAGAVGGRRLGRAFDVLALAGYAVPGFWLALVLVTLFAVTVPLLPATGYVGWTESPVEWARSLVLPVATLSLPGVAVFAKQTREALLGTLSREFVTALQANGASQASVVLRHGLRNAGIPVVTLVGLTFIGLLSGTVLVESVFAMPGLGGLAVQAATQRDIPVLQGVVVVFTLVVVAANLTVDLVYGWLDPKVRTP
ncbi:ABC transporter permease [Nonomuraea sp. CA-141351]|uniref:ABC transporter permease n=1 Tax=Nonomuraea sp. CA-141351 TaxID=3239996 RepID=UPI003D9331DB